jgi:hypothetical protein
MRNINRFALALTALLLAALACNLPQSQPPANSDPNLAFTAAAQTVAAQLTKSVLSTDTATSLPPLPPSITLTSVPTLTSQAPTIQPPTVPQTSTQECDKAQFIDDITYPDNSILSQEQLFTKTWRIKNIGTCSWTPSYTMAFSNGEQMSGPSVQALTGNVNPGQTVDISANLKAPSANGTHTGYWKLRNASGVTFTQFYVQIKVQGGGGGIVDPFRVTGVSYSVSGSCGNFHIIANFTTNGAGTVEYYWEFNGNDPDEGTYGSTLVFGFATMKPTPVLDWYITAPGDHYARVYIQSPNHQFIGQANVHCP